MPALGNRQTDSRATQILRAARQIFLRDGWDYFSVERIADFAECSRPLVYRHFPSKEEILLALAIESKERRIRLGERATAFRGTPRERMLAIGEVEDLLLPRDLPVELLVASTCMRAKTSRARQDQLKVLDVRAVTIASSVIRDAINAGDLKLPDSMRPEELLFSMWAIRWGSANIMRSDMPLPQAGVVHPRTAVLHSLGNMLDGYGWRPLMKDFDYGLARDRVYEQVFTQSVVEEILHASFA